VVGEPVNNGPMVGDPGLSGLPLGLTVAEICAIAAAERMGDSRGIVSPTTGFEARATALAEPYGSQDLTARPDPEAVRRRPSPLVLADGRNPVVKAKRLKRRGYQGVTAYVGLPGSGKTYTLTDVACRALLAGREVWTNRGYEVSIGGLSSKTFASFDDFLSIPNDAVICWDELPLFVNARKWQEFPDGLMYRLTQIRKDSLELHYSAIDWLMVDANVRRITFWVWECNRLGLGVHRRAMYPPEERRRKDERPRQRELFRIRPHIAASYDSWSKVAVAAPALSAAKAERAAKQWSSPSVPAATLPSEDR